MEIIYTALNMLWHPGLSSQNDLHVLPRPVLMLCVVVIFYLFSWLRILMFAVLWFILCLVCTMKCFVVVISLSACVCDTVLTQSIFIHTKSSYSTNQSKTPWCRDADRRQGTVALVSQHAVSPTTASLAVIRSFYGTHR